ncbi:MAG TPA: hypothetical protein VFU14_16260 [Acidimicrobiales bacterium]|nr:hypothetical protein [Acidimicrobiales bacterium]
MRRLTLALPAVMGAVCGAYTIIYLVRWEWNRAIIAGLFFVAVEIVFAVLVLLGRFRRIEDRLDELTAPVSAADDGRSTAADPLDAIQAAAPPPRDHFAWIRDQHSTTNVFLPVLLGAGVLASSLAWVVERVAHATFSPVAERRLVERLGVLQPPPGGLTGPPHHPPAPRPERRALRAAVAAAALGIAAYGTIGAIDFVADRTQSRPDSRVSGAITEIELELRGELASRNPQRAFEHLWSVCTGPDVFRLRSLPDPDVAHRAAGYVHVRLQTDVGANGMERLRGCLNDATIDKVQARVVSSTVLTGS